MADYVVKQGDTAITFPDTLTYSDGSSPNLAGASVKFVMRALTSTDVTTNASATIVNATSPASITYTPTAQDTANAGLFAANWIVTFAGGAVEQFPTIGYLTVEVQENLTTPGGASIVALGDVKDYLNLPATDRTHDGELLRFIDGVTPVVEGIVGPVVQRVYQNETYDGGNWFLSLRHRPVISVSELVEYRGNIKYVLTQVPTPDLGTIYSYMFEPGLGRIIRTTVGGGITPFPTGPDRVFVTYTAGFVKVPENVRLGTLELLRVNYQQTQQAGRRPFGASPDDNEPGQQMLGFFVPGRVRELLAPNRRHPSVA